ncbi:FMN-linked oxidoreductase [Cryphonectria parasitica EP155]|uniref:FMN-linked oxidoreductase n=1 Tax=Cryphonectria parasitica (strain ATCC 38755 / EP155) TaxID=660469 RepID=A0A9P5CQV7_CRYP1|nr:FMN-linked oxidoreductase [Cryphonectria parasitica EP155]KAF3766862.1 FMN-linked oxidoreductase [Cryphonectria parasitica EP155]
MAPARFEAEDVDPSPLGQPLKFEFSGHTAKNRFMKAAMTERLSTWDPVNIEKRGVPKPELINVYRRWGEGGYGVILSGNVMIEYDHLEAPGNPIIPYGAPFEGERFEAFRELAAAGKKEGSLFLAQVSHPGRQVVEAVQPHPISASDVQLEGEVMGMTFAKPRAMEKKDIERVVEGFAHAAEYAQKAGFDGIQLHGAHGYLLAQFLAPSTNKRTDEYGGSLRNRARIILEIADAIKARVKGKPFTLGIKINSVEFQKGGFSTEDCAELCEELEKHGFDFVELSGGTYEELAFSHKKESTKKREAFFLEFADMIAPRLHKTKTYVVGGLRTAKGMIKALDSVQGVSLGRPTAHEFDLPKKILEGKAKSAIQYKIDEQNFGVTNVAAGTQIRLVGNDKEPLDLSQEKQLEVFMQSLQQWSEIMANNKDGSKYGFVDIEGLELQPFGTPYVA